MACFLVGVSSFNTPKCWVKQNWLPSLNKHFRIQIHFIVRLYIAKLKGALVLEIIIIFLGPPKLKFYWLYMYIDPISLISARYNK